MELLSRLFALIITIVLPIAAAIWMSVKKKGYLKPVLLGVATFLVFQVITRIPLLQLLGMTAWYAMFAASQPVLLALFLGATAALFEEGGRWIVMTLFMKNKHRVTDGIAFGIGHGGFESVLLVGVSLIAAMVTNQLTATPGEILMGGAERLMTMVIHVSWSVMVLKSVVLKKPQWLLLAFILHTVIDMGAVLMAQAGIAPLWIEAAILVCAAALLIYTVAEYKKYKGVEIQ